MVFWKLYTQVSVLCNLSTLATLTFLLNWLKRGTENIKVNVIIDLNRRAFVAKNVYNLWFSLQTNILIKNYFSFDEDWENAKLWCYKPAVNSYNSRNKNFSKIVNSSNSKVHVRECSDPCTPTKKGRRFHGLYSPRNVSWRKVEMS